MIITTSISLTHLIDRLRLQEIPRRYEISPYMFGRSRGLRKYKIVVVFDDSGSMRTPINHGAETRWDYLCKIFTMVFELAAIFDSNGVDLYFLNNEPVLRVKSVSQVKEIFSTMEQTGNTPLVPVLERVF